MSYKSTNWKEWILPLHEENVLVGDAYDNLNNIGAEQREIPEIVRIVEHKKSKFFPGGTDIKTHDYIHIVLGRGLLSLDEAFVLGFTMGCTNVFSQDLIDAFCFIASELYPQNYKFCVNCINIFQDAAYLGHISDCKSLSDVDYTKYHDLTVKELREELGIETDLLQAFYNLEKKRYPNEASSKRLLQN